MDKFDWYIPKLVGSAVLIACGVGGMMISFYEKESLKTKEAQNSIANKFQTASAEERLASIQRDLVAYSCNKPANDKATGLQYDPIATVDNVTDQALRKDGCTIKIGGRVIAPALAP